VYLQEVSDNNVSFIKTKTQAILAVIAIIGYLGLSFYLVIDTRLLPISGFRWPIVVLVYYTAFITVENKHDKYFEVGRAPLVPFNIMLKVSQQKSPFVEMPFGNIR